MPEEKKPRMTKTEWAHMYGMSVLIDLFKTHPICRDWVVKHSNSGPTVCMHSSKTILLEPIEDRPTYYVFELLMHEIAHVLCGPMPDGHDPHNQDFYMHFATLILVYLVGGKRIKAYRRDDRVKVEDKESQQKQPDFLTGPWESVEN